MDYKYTNISGADNNFELKVSDKIHPCLLENNRNDVIKALNFLASDEKFLYIHGFLGTGKRQFVNYICEYLLKDVVKLEYYCKQATVCDDILLAFTSVIENLSATKTLKLNAKITTLSVKFQKLIESAKRPYLIILHSLDNVSEDNLKIISEIFSKTLKEQNVKIIITTCALRTGLLNDVPEDKTIFLKAFTKDIFKEFVQSNNLNAPEKQVEDFYKLTRGYYYYTALSIKIIQTLNISLAEFLQKIKNADSTFDNYIGELYVSLIPVAIRNFFWFMRAIRHGITLNALAILEIYDEFTLQYLKTNFVTFQAGETLYLQDYFAQRVDILLPENTEIRLHKYIIGIYEQQLKEPLTSRAILISRQSLRAEIDYHSQIINALENGGLQPKTILPQDSPLQGETAENTQNNNSGQGEDSVQAMLEEAKKLIEEDKITDGIEKLNLLLEHKDINSTTLMDVRLSLARTYCKCKDYTSALHYYELAETYYKNNKELINLNYLYYEMTDLFYKMYKNERAIETIKKVIYSVDTPQSLMVSSCTLLGNIYSDTNDSENAFLYYQKALDSLDENVGNDILSELYFKFALANDDKGDLNLAFEYYNRCISITGEDNKYLAAAYSNLASCYYENGNGDDALDCFVKAYNIEKDHNNYDGIYYTTSHIAKILGERKDKETKRFLKEAKQSAEFLNEPFYMIEASVALGDYYYNIPGKAEKALTEYCRAKQIALLSEGNTDITNIDKRIEDMKLRMPADKYAEVTEKYAR